jgi:hypothetical protein
MWMTCFDSWDGLSDKDLAAVKPVEGHSYSSYAGSRHTCNTARNAPGSGFNAMICHVRAGLE